ncbi:dienelactone hydrolase family protein [Chloroflexota bacterium]
MPTPTTTPTPTPIPTPTPALKTNWTEVDAPPGVSFTDAQWIEIDASEGRKILAAYFRPAGTSPFPVVVVLHGSEGFRGIHVQLAQDFAKNGFIGVAGSWFGGHYHGVQSPIPIKHDDGIDWPNGPDLKAGNDLSAVKDVLALINAARTLPSAHADRVGVISHSRGAAIALTTASTGEELQAVVAAAGYPSGIILNNLKPPILILNGTADQVIPIQRAERFESSLKRLGKSVESHYYEGAPHKIPWTLPWSEHVRRHAIEFFSKHLAPS